MKNLFVDIKAVIDINDNDSIELLAFEKAVISNLYKIKRLGYNLFFIIDDGLLSKPSVQKAISILNGEFKSGIINNAENINDTGDYLIEKIDNQLLLKTGQDVKKCYGWEEIFSLIKSSSRKVVHTRNTNETKIEIELNELMDE